MRPALFRPKIFCIAASLIAGASATAEPAQATPEPAQATPVYVSISTYSTCPTQTLGNVTVQLNAATYKSSAHGDLAETLAAGVYQVRASAANAPALTYVRFYDMAKGTQQQFNAIAGVATFNTGMQGGQLWVYVNNCAQRKPPVPNGGTSVAATGGTSVVFGQPVVQAEQRDASGRLTVEGANVTPFTCGGASYYLYQYVNRPAGQPSFRVISPPDFSHPIGGKDFATRDQAVSAAC